MSWRSPPPRLTPGLLHGHLLLVVEVDKEACSAGSSRAGHTAARLDPRPAAEAVHDGLHASQRHLVLLGGIADLLEGVSKDSVDSLGVVASDRESAPLSGSVESARAA